VKFIVDAQLPKRLTRILKAKGYDAIHTLDLPKRNRTPDEEILEVAKKEARIVVTKDADFVNSHTLFGKPERLLLISTGNISNPDLEALLLSALSQVILALGTSNFIELTRANVIVH
jgi:predicted nuclease of predicted toxin-antitoxin system